MLAFSVDLFDALRLISVTIKRETCNVIKSYNPTTEEALPVLQEFAYPSTEQNFASFGLVSDKENKLFPSTLQQDSELW